MLGITTEVISPSAEVIFTRVPAGGGLISVSLNNAINSRDRIFWQTSNRFVALKPVIKTVTKININ